MPVIILGMHGSGTSALTGCVNLMGLSVGPERDSMRSAAEHPRGCGNHTGMMHVNGEILAAFHGSALQPPYLRERWWTDPRLKELRTLAGVALRETFPSPQWCWEEPQTCLTLPFWAELLPEKPVVLFINRNPLEIHQSLEAHEGLTKRGALALWQVYMTYTVRALAGLPVLVLRFEALLEQTQSCLARIRSFLERQGIGGLATPEPAAVNRLLASTLRHERCTDREFMADEEVTEEQRRLWEVLNDLPHESKAFAAPILPGADMFLETLLWANQECAAAHIAKLEQDSASAQATAEEREGYIVELEQAKAWAMEQRVVSRRLVDEAQARAAQVEQELQLLKAPFWRRMQRRLIERARRSPAVRGALRRLAATYRGAAR